MPVWVLRSLLGLALTALALTAASNASAQITPTDAGFAVTQAGSLTIRTPLLTVTCSSSALAGTTPSSSSATSLPLSSISFSGCSSPLGTVTVTTSGSWSIGLPTLSSSPGSGAAALIIPSGGLSAVVGGSVCTFRGGGTLAATWSDGGSAVDQSASPSSQLAVPAGTLTLSGTCPGVTSGTVTATYNVTDTSSPVQLWAGVGLYAAAPNPFEFPETRAGSDSTRSIRVDNNSNADVTITRVNVVGDAVFSVDVGAGFVVEANTSAPVDVRFAPTAARDYRAKIELLDAAGNVKFTIEVKGRGR